MNSRFDQSVPRLEDVATLATCLSNKAEDSKSLVVVELSGAGLVFVAPGDSPEQVDIEIMEAIADGPSELHLLSDADFTS